VRALIARCPQCQTRYRIARDKIGPQGARIRCSGCQTIFRVQVPPEEATPLAPAAGSPAPPVARALIADADAARARAIAGQLTARRISADVIENGAQALLRIFRDPPDLVVLGGHLPGVSAPVIAELLRRTAGLRDLPSVRIAPPDEPAGAPEFEAHATLAPAALSGGLVPILERLGIGRAPEAPRPAVAPAPRAAASAPAPPAPAARNAPAPAPRTPAAPAPAPAARPPVAAADPEVAKAERLARITVSDIILYNEGKFAAAAASGKIAEALAHELQEARQHFDSRVPAAIRSGRDFLVEELQRRAAQQRAPQSRAS
jgi:predicted Zn finger-like uncharacterized protein